MPLQVFDFPAHSATHSFPAGDQMRFGGGYSFASEPDRPVQKLFNLHFDSLVHIKNPYTGAWLRGADTRVSTPENTILTELKRRSIWALNDFYDEHMLHKTFNYTHYAYGLLVVRFATAFEMPPAAEGTRNIVNHIPTNGFDIKLIEQPL